MEYSTLKEWGWILLCPFFWAIIVLYSSTHNTHVIHNFHMQYDQKHCPTEIILKNPSSLS